MNANNYKEIDNSKELARVHKEIAKTKPSAQFQFFKPPDFHQCSISQWAAEDGFFFVQFMAAGTEKQSAYRGLLEHVNEFAFFNSFLFTSQVIFKAKFMGIDEAKGLQFSFPDKLMKVQRRKHMRVPLSHNVKAEATLTLINPTDMKSTQITRPILDLSMGGMAIKPQKDDAELIKQYPKLHMIDIVVGDITMTGPGIIRNQTDSKIGIEMDLSNQIQLKKFAAFLVSQLRVILGDSTINDLA